MMKTSDDRLHSTGFTLVELLVVIAIIAMLVTLLVPAMRGAIERANQAKCKSNLRNIGIAMISFADDHRGHLPGSFSYGSGPENWQKSFMGGEVSIPGGASSTLWGVPPNTMGTLLPYLPVAQDNARAIYRCPSLKPGQLGSGSGSNGMFDYLMLQSFAGAMVSRIPTRSILYRGQSGMEREVGTPLIVEGKPLYHMNTSQIAPGFAAGGRLGTHHANYVGFYVTIDGRVEEVRSPNELGPESTEWEVRVGGAWRRISEPLTAFGKLPWDPQPTQYERINR